MDKCPACGRQLFIGPSEFVSEAGKQSVYNKLSMVCINPDCKNYSGPDTKNPKKVAMEIKLPANKYAKEESGVT